MAAYPNRYRRYRRDISLKNKWEQPFRSFLNEPSFFFCGQVADATSTGTGSNFCALPHHAERTSFQPHKRLHFVVLLVSLVHNFSLLSFVITSVCFVCTPIPSECSLWNRASNVPYNCQNWVSFKKIWAVWCLFSHVPQQSTKKLVYSSRRVVVPIHLSGFNCKSREMCVHQCRVTFCK